MRQIDLISVVSDPVRRIYNSMQLSINLFWPCYVTVITPSIRLVCRSVLLNYSSLHSLFFYLHLNLVLCTHQSLPCNLHSPRCKYPEVQAVDFVHWIFWMGNIRYRNRNQSAIANGFQVTMKKGPITHWEIYLQLCSMSDCSQGEALL